MNSLPMRASAAALSMLGLSAISAHAVTYSIDLTSGSSIAPPFLAGDDLLNPPPGGPAPPAIAGAGLGYEVDAISYGRTSPVVVAIYFSVTRTSFGVAGTAVATESATGDQPADIFVTTSGTIGTNAQVYDGNGSSAPSLGLIEPIGAFPAEDNLDALDMRISPVVIPPLGPSVFWSVDPATAVTYGGGATAADIFWAPALPGYSGMPVLYAPFFSLGLMPGDDIDAMVYVENGTGVADPGDTVFFSLTPGSPTLAALGYAPGTGGADVFTTSPGAPLPTLFAPAAALGLLATDDIDALDIVPEASHLMLLGLTALGWTIRRRRA